MISKGSVQIDGIDIDKEELNIQIEDISHFSSIYENNYVVSLNTTLDANLINEGIAREFIHNVQNIRKEAGFNIEDRISIEFQGERELSEAILQFEKYISSETLALKIEESNLNHSGDFKSTILGKEISLNISKVI